VLEIIIHDSEFLASLNVEGLETAIFNDARSPTGFPYFLPGGPRARSSSSNQRESLEDSDGRCARRIHLSEVCRAGGTAQHPPASPWTVGRFCHQCSDRGSR